MEDVEHVAADQAVAAMGVSRDAVTSATSGAVAALGPDAHQAGRPVSETEDRIRAATAAAAGTVGEVRRPLDLAARPARPGGPLGQVLLPAPSGPLATFGFMRDGRFSPLPASGNTQLMAELAFRTSHSDHLGKCQFGAGSIADWHRMPGKPAQW